MPLVPQHAYQFRRQRLVQQLENHLTVRSVPFRHRPALGMFARNRRMAVTSFRNVFFMGFLLIVLSPGAPSVEV